MIKIIQGIMAIAILSVVVGIVMPGFIMYINHTFYEQDVINILDSTAKRKFELNRLEQSQYEEKKQNLLRQLKNISTSPEQINQIAAAIENIEKIKKSSNKISVASFYPKNNTLPLWPLLYFGFGCIIFLQGRHLPGRIKIKDFIILFSLIFLFWRSTTWFRNTPLGKINRIIYSAHNIDISALGFFLQELLSTVSLGMLSYIICKWIAHSNDLKEKLHEISDYDLIAENLRNVYKNWQVTSLFLTFGFGYYTYYFWTVVNDTHDMRYLPQAIVVHFVWGIAWFSVSWPLIISTEIHSNYREKITRKINISSAVERTDLITDHLYKNDPISAQNKMITTLLSGLAFLFPLIKSFL